MLDITLDPIALLYVFIALVVGITIHEAMHAFSSHWLGDDTAHREGRISLNPLRHIDLFSTILLPIITLILFKIPLLAAKPVPFNPDRVKYDEFGAAMVAVAGPLTNLSLAAIFGGLIHLVGDSLSAGVIEFFVIFTVVNVGLFVFNMIPIPPLDGSRLLYAFAPETVQKFMAGLELVGIFIIFALIVTVPTFSEVLININQQISGFLLGVRL